ncbi:MAG: DNA repair protein RadA [Patescibacteria group bacterium]|nr:DNA repair protein RadA [Patescibacteria group bacterium]
MKKNTKIYLCENCGNEFSTWSGRCDICGEWNTLKEMSIPSVSSSLGSSRNSRELKAVKLSEIENVKNFRINTKINEFNRVLGGGIVPGSLILIGGEPGIGKSTLLLQVSNSIEQCLYISAEESLQQIKDRADRLGINSSKLELISDGDILSIEKEILKSKPDLIIIDSIQTVYLNTIPSTPGSIVQVRECGIFLQKLAKTTSIPIVIIGHVTKEGSLAGPRMLEHLVDTVLYLEGERFHDARILRGVKNRFGATNEVGIFSIQEKGLVEISNPSALFLSETTKSAGSVITATIEGTRPILVEVQALVIPTHFGYPKRTSSGFDLNRLNLLSAVISKKTPINLGNYDIYVNIVGGMKIGEPAIDLAVCGAIISSFKNKPLSKNLCLFGEVGLSGEIRKVVRYKEREKEATALGYKVLENPKNINDLIGLL